MSDLPKKVQAVYAKYEAEIAHLHEQLAQAERERDHWHEMYSDYAAVQLPAAEAQIRELVTALEWAMRFVDYLRTHHDGGAGGCCRRLHAGGVRCPCCS